MERSSVTTKIRETWKTRRKPAITRTPVSFRSRWKTVNVSMVVAVPVATIFNIGANCCVCGLLTSIPRFRCLLWSVPKIGVFSTTRHGKISLISATTSRMFSQSIIRRTRWISIWCSVIRCPMWSTIIRLLPVGLTCCRNMHTDCVSVRICWKTNSIFWMMLYVSVRWVSLATYSGSNRNGWRNVMISRLKRNGTIRSFRLKLIGILLAIRRKKTIGCLSAVCMGWGITWGFGSVSSMIWAFRRRMRWRRRWGSLFPGRSTGWIIWRTLWIMV